MVTLTVLNSWERLYTKVLRDNNIPFLYECNGEHTSYTIKDNDCQMVTELFNNARMNKYRVDLT